MLSLCFFSKEQLNNRRARFSSPLLFSLFLALIFSFAGQMDIARAAVPSVVPLSDTDGDGFPEIGIFIRNAANTKNRSYVMDANSGPADYVIKLGIPSNLDPLFQVVVPDLNSNGSPELAMLGVTYASGVIDTVRVIVKDTLTGSAIINMGFDKDFPPVAMAVVEYPSGHTASNVGIAVLGRRLPTGGPGTSLTKVSVRDAVSGAIITNTYYMQTFTPIAMAVIPDITGTAGGLTNAPEIAVLGLRDADVTWGGVVSVILTDVGAGAANNGWVTFIGMDSNVNPVDMVAIPDMNGNGSMELAVVGINLTNGNGVVSIREPIKVSGVSPTLNTLVFPPEYPAVSIEAVPDFTDVNGTGSANGMPEIAVFGLGDPTAGDGSGVLDRTKVYVRDASAVTGEWIGILSFGESFPTKAMVVVDNYNSIAPYTSAPELAVLGVDGGGTMLVTTKDILYDGAKIDSFYVPPEYQISANVTNLGSQGQLRLRNNGIWAAGITADGTYSPPGWLTSDEANYVVTVHSSSPVQNCVITGGSNGDGSGEVGLSPVTVDVDCTPGGSTYAVGGSVIGLTGTVVLQNNGGDNLSRSANGSFTFATPVNDGSSYNVTVLTDPTGQTCAVTNGSGTISGANVTNVSVSCTTNPPPTYTVGGNISGLTGTVVLQNNGGDNLSRSANGSFTFATPVNDGSSYNVTVLTDPIGQTCAVTNGSGTISGADVTNVSVSCATNPPPGSPNVAGTASPTNDNTPIWTWTSGGGGNGTFRYKLDDSNLSTGATQTAFTLYMQISPLSDGTHTLYVQESNGTTWSSSGFFAITIDTAPPTITSVNPADGGTNVPGNTTVSATFDGVVDTSTITGSSFTLSCGNSVAGSISFSAGDTVATFMPDNAIPNSTTCTPTIGVGVTDVAGNAFVSIYSWSFTTAENPIIRIPANGSGERSLNPSISEDGRYVAFEVDAPGYGSDSVFVHDVQTGVTTLANVPTGGSTGSGWGYEALVNSVGGRYIAFRSWATTLVTGDTNGFDDVFLHDTQTGTTTRVSVANDGSQSDNASRYPSISSDGRYVAFHSAATNLVAGGTSGSEIFVRDTVYNTTILASINSSGVGGNGSSSNPSISSNGQSVAFESDAANFVSGDTNGFRDIFVHDMQTGATTLVSVHTNGTQSDGWSYAASISADGRYVAFHSSATNIVDGDTNGTEDVFLHDTQTGTTVRVSVNGSGAEGNGLSRYPSVSSDGRYVAFESLATNLVAGGSSGAQIFVRDTTNNTTKLVSANVTGVEGDGGSEGPSISVDGRYVVFQSDATNLVTGDTNGLTDVFRAPNLP